jgi:preprotein translocase subunit SecE
LTNQRLVGIAYAIFALLIGFVLEQALGQVFAATGLNWLNDATLFGVEGWSYTTAIGYALAIGGAIVCWFNAKVRGVSEEVAGELRKVTWPTRKETQAATVAVVITTLVFSVILGFVDYAWAFVTEQIYRGAGL